MDYFRMRLEKAESRRRWGELTELVNAWDPVGLIAMGAPGDEYDCVVGDVLRALERGESAAGLAGLLATHLPEHFGSAVANPKPFAEQAVAWYNARWPGSHA